MQNDGRQADSVSAFNMCALVVHLAHYARNRPFNKTTMLAVQRGVHLAPDVFRQRNQPQQCERLSKYLK
jgi:hypothetical protein